MNIFRSLLLSFLLTVSLHAKSAQEHLSQYGVNMQVARDFIMNNYANNLSLVHQTCKDFGVNNDMIAEILASDFPGVTGQVVSGFFDGNGFDGNTLGFTNNTEQTNKK